MGDLTRPSRSIPVPGGEGRSRSRNPYGAGAPDAKARRAIGEVFRELADAETLGKALLSIAAGIDPWADKRAGKNPDKVPVPVLAEGIPWTTRDRALELFLAYHSGKPAQSVVVQAEIDQRIAMEGTVLSGPLDMRQMTPEQRQAFRHAALAALGRLPVGPVLDANVAPSDAAPSACDGAPVSVQLLGSAPSQEEVRLSVEGQLAELDQVGVGVAVVGGHEGSVVPEPAEVKHEEKEIVLEFRDSANLVDARLAGGVCTVRFRGSDGQVARTYKYANVTREMMRSWREAPSAGAWFAREIRKKSQMFPLIVRPIPVVV